MYSGQSSEIMFWLIRKFRQSPATRSRALSCCKINWRCCTRDTSTRRNTSFLCLTVVKLSTIIIKCDFTLWEIPPQTITEPPKSSGVSKVDKCDIDNLCEKSETGLVCKNTKTHPVSTALSEIFWWMCRQSRYTTHAYHGRTDIRRRAQSCNRFLTVPGWTGRLWMQTVIRTVSMAVRWWLRRCERWIALSWRHAWASRPRLVGNTSVVEIFTPHQDKT